MLTAITIILFLLAAGGLTWGFSAATGVTGGWLVPVYVLMWVLLHLLYVVVIYLGAIGVDMDKPIEKQRPLCRFGCGHMSGPLCVYAGFAVRLVGVEKLPTDRRFLYVCNHRSLFDPLIVMHFLRRYNIPFVSKPSNLRIPLIGRLAYATGFLAIDRENDRKALRTILTAADYLKRDVCSMGIYPEGTRSKTGELLPFHAGSFKIAQKARVPLAIACIRGTEQLRQHPLRLPKRATLEILEVLEPERVQAMSTHELSEYSRGLIEAALKREEAGA